MSGKRRPSSPRRAPGREEHVAPGRDAGAAAATAALGLALAGVGLAVDPGAAAAFDAPKRLIALAGTVAAVAALVLLRPPGAPAATAFQGRAPWARAARLLFLVALGAGTVAALASPRLAVAFDAWRGALVLAALVPVGASRALEAGGSGTLLGAFLGACGVNAAVSLLQLGGGLRPFAGAAVVGRTDTGALIGNEGQLALLVALAILPAVTVALLARRPAVRLGAAALLPLFAATLIVNRNLTAWTALLAGGLVLVLARLRARTGPALLLLVLVLASGLAVGVLSPLRTRVADVARDLRAGEWDPLLSYRLGPWAAAVEMVRARPLTGWGPGTFGAEMVPHRLRAESRLRTRLVNPFLAGSYAEAHSDYLQAFAEGGMPAGLAALGAAAVLLIGLGRLAADPAAPRPVETLALLGLLVTGAVAALTWFPFLRPVSAMPLLLGAGRAWRLVARGRSPGG